jgi:hypothetical protein
MLSQSGGRKLDAGVDSSGTAIAAAARLDVSRILQMARPTADLAQPMMPVPVEWRKPRQ